MKKQADTLYDGVYGSDKRLVLSIDTDDQGNYIEIHLRDEAGDLYKSFGKIYLPDPKYREGKAQELKKLADDLEKHAYYEDYGFVLEWEELSEDLREAKIEQYIRFNHMGEYLSEEDQGLDEDKIIEKYRDEADSDIAARFPMYF